MALMPSVMSWTSFWILVGSMPCCWLCSAWMVRRRSIQADHNKQHGIEPQSIQKEVHDITEGIKAIAESRTRYNVVRKEMSRTDMFKVVKDLEVQMKESAKSLQFEKAAQFRDEIFELRRLLALEEKIIGPGDLMPEDVAAALEEDLA